MLSEDELQEVQEMAEREYFCDTTWLRQMIPKLLSHIDAQADEIADLRKQLSLVKFYGED